MNRQEIFDVIQSNIRMIIDDTEDKEINETNSMRDFGADSLQIVEVVSRSMRQLRIKIPRTKLLEAGNLKELLDLFEHQARAVH